MAMASTYNLKVSEAVQRVHGVCIGCTEVVGAEGFHLRQHV